MSAGNLLKIGLGAAAVCAAGIGLLLMHDEDKKPKTPKTPKATNKDVDETIESLNASLKLIPQEQIVELINEVSDTMSIVFQQLGMMAIDMTQQGMSEHDINTEISQKFKSTMSIVEKQTCESHGIPWEQYEYSFNHWKVIDDKKFRNARYPCRYLLSTLEGTYIEKPSLPSDLDVKKAILLNNAVLELSIRCINRIKEMLCDEMHIDMVNLRERISSNPSLQDNVFDLVVDAEKNSKKKILKDEEVDEADLIICSLVYRDNKVFSSAMDSIGEKRVHKLAELGLRIYIVFNKQQ